VIIRPVDIGEIAALAELARRTYSDAFGHTFSASDLVFHLKTNLSDAYFRHAFEDDVILVAIVKNRMAGFVQFGAVRMSAATPSPTDQELRRLYIDAEFQNQRIGTRLMLSALAHPRLRAAQNIYLDVWERNLGAQKLYREHGFEVIGAHPLAVASGIAADQDLIMVRRASHSL
jgi:diamine N-acetyltransferase